MLIMNILAKCEYFVPTVVSDLIQDNKVTCDVLSTNAVWYGVTYKEDKDYVVKSIKDLVKSGEYPEHLYK